MSANELEILTRKRIGEGIILAVFLFTDVWGFWHDHRFICLSLACLSVLALLLYDGAASRNQIAVLVVLCVLGSGVLYVFVPSDPGLDVEVIGTLQASNETAPPTACGSSLSLTGAGGPRVLPPDTLKILIGSNAYVSSPGISKITAIKIGSCDVLTMEKTQTGINVGAELYDADGRLIARIANNEFHAISGAHSHVERQNNLSTLIVKDADDAELLYVHYLNPTTVRARGVFGCPGHAPVAFTNGGQAGGTCLNVGYTAVSIP